MRWLLISFCLLLAGWQAQAKPISAFGLGLESRIQPEVNPDYSQLQNMPQFYYELLFPKWGFDLEYNQQTRSSNAGNLSVDARSFEISAWTRYQFHPPGNWTPYLSGGLGLEFDRVNTSFAGSNDSRSSNLGFAGLGAGVSYSAWDFLLMELEVRGELFENYEAPLVSGILRIGIRTQ